ncbi:MAG TPA: SDR family oxidoreductase [Verrucomicrobiae bacterium]|nr:SDR family oxidoreductase [Verrucomicrobiae bacterium]
MKTALITGSSKGIGYEVARQLGGRGFHVFVSARNREAGLKAAAALQKSGAKINFVELDVNDPASIRAAAESVLEQVGQLDVLVNNAGIVEDGDENVLQVDGEIVLRTFATNALGALRVAQAFVPVLLKADKPRIINVSSRGGQLSDMGTWSPAYCISKTALNAITCQLAGSLRDKDIAVNSACPGWVRTDMGGSNAPRSVEEGADTIVWLATEAPHNLTGKFFADRQEIPW